MYCVICSRKVSTGNEEGEEGGGISPAAKSVVQAPGFLTTFNEIWRILERQKDEIATDTDINLTTLTGLSNDTDVPLVEPPTMCQRCCDKVVSVENLIKAVRHQVREINMLFYQRRRKNEEGQYDDSEEMQITQDDWTWQEPGSALSQTAHSSSSLFTSAPKSKDFSQLLTSFIFEASDNETPMECDDEDEEEDNKKSEDPDYIKSEGESDNHDADDDDSEEINSCSEDEQEQELLVPMRNLHSTPPDPLANYMHSFLSNLQKSIHSSNQSPSPLTPSPKFPDSKKKHSKQNKGPFICDVEGCRREVKTEKGLYFHKQKIHPDNSRIMYPCDAPGCQKSFADPKSTTRHKKTCHPDLITVKFEEIPSSSSSSSQLICGLEGCSRVLQNEMGLTAHKMRCHPNIFKAEVEKNKKDNSQEFLCSCGKSFGSKETRYRHIIKNKAQHPEYKKDPRKDGTGQKCDICHEAIPFSELFQHLTNHLNGRSDYVIKCPNDKCPNLYTNSKGLGKHISNSQTACGKVALEKNIDLECESCGFTTTERLSLRNHVENHESLGTSEKIWSCPMANCGKMFGVKQSIYFHLSTHQIEPISRMTTQKCDKCGMKISVGEIGEHLKDKHGILEKDVIGCKQCPFKFSEKDELVEHLYEHRHVGIICDICGAEGDDVDKTVKYFRYVHFREHYLSVHQLCPKKYKCDEEGCENNEGFWRKLAKIEHYRVRHKSDEKRGKRRKRDVMKKDFVCELCLVLNCEGEGVKFVSEIDLINHKISVHREDPYCCETCGEKFNKREKFCRHKKEVHGGVKFQKEWKCEVEGCRGRVFSKSRNFKRHMEIYHVEGGKKYVCDVCGKGFGYNQGLIGHKESVHLKLRRWICEECGEGFTSAKVLRRHKLIHTGERPFGCEICGQRFRHKEVLRRHVIGHEEKGKDFKPNGPMKHVRKRKTQ